MPIREEISFATGSVLDMRRWALVKAPAGPTVEWAWLRQRVWSQTADKLRAGPRRVWGIRLVLTVAAAALALAGSQVRAVSLGTSVVLAVVAAAAMAAVGLLRGRQSIEQALRWRMARSVSEAIKTEVLLFLTHSGRYSVPGADHRLEAEVWRLERQAGGLKGYTDRVQAKIRSLPAVHDIDSYLEVRVRQWELDGYYRPKALLLRQRLRAAKVAEVTLALVAAALAAMVAISPTVGAWAAVATTAGGAVAAYIAAERFEVLWVEYSRTASELRRLLERRTAADGSPLSDSDLIGECEQVISVQNHAWMAKWGEESTANAD